MKNLFKRIAIALCITMLLPFTSPLKSNAYSQPDTVMIGNEPYLIETLADNDSIRKVKVTNRNEIVIATYDKKKDVVNIMNNDGTEKNINLNNNSYTTKGEIVYPLEVDPIGGGGGNELKYVGECYAYSESARNRYGYYIYQGTTDSSVIYWEFKRADVKLSPGKLQNNNNSSTIYAIKSDIDACFAARRSIAATFGLAVLAGMLAGGIPQAISFIASLYNLTPQEQQALYKHCGSEFNRMDNIDANLRRLGYNF